MSEKIRIRVGEIEYEGGKEFAKNELPDLIEAISKALKIAQVSGDGGFSIADSRTNGTNSEVATNLSTDSVAANLNIETQKALVTAACAKLTFVERKDTFSRGEILDSMKEATSRYTENHSKNLTRYLNRLVQSKQLVKHGNDTYALHANIREDLRGKALG